VYGRAELHSFTDEQVQALYKQVAPNGRLRLKKRMIDFILKSQAQAHGGVGAPRAAQIQRTGPRATTGIWPALLRQWELSPLGTDKRQATRKGRENEAHVLSHLRRFVAEHAHDWQVGAVRQYGLMGRRGDAHRWLLTSVDACAELIYKGTSAYAAAVEVKTAVAVDRERSAHELAVKYGSFVYARPDDEAFAAMIPPDHRSQLVHHCAALNLDLALYIKASSKEIFFCCLVDTSACGLREAYERVISRLVDVHCPILKDPVGSSEPDFEAIFEGFDLQTTVRDVYTMKQRYYLRKEVMKIVTERKALEPLPFVKDVRPAVVNDWNLLKGEIGQRCPKCVCPALTSRVSHCWLCPRAGGVDILSRYLANIGSFFDAAPPLFTLFERCTMLLLCNAYIVYNMAQKHDQLMAAQSFKRFNEVFSERTSFRQFLTDLWLDTSAWNDLYGTLAGSPGKQISPARAAAAASSLGAAGQLGPPGHSRCNRKRPSGKDFVQHFDKDGKDVRLGTGRSKSHRHAALPMQHGERSVCALCGLGSQVGPQGGRTSSECDTCVLDNYHVPLCTRIKRRAAGDARPSCFQLWHSEPSVVRLRDSILEALRGNVEERRRRRAEANANSIAPPSVSSDTGAARQEQGVVSAARALEEELKRAQDMHT
jgi:hypothetical protein